MHVVSITRNTAVLSLIRLNFTLPTKNKLLTRAKFKFFNSVFALNYNINIYKALIYKN